MALLDKQRDGMKRLIVLIAVFAAHAHASNWVTVAGMWDFSDPASIVFQVDKETVQLRDGLVQAWVRASVGAPRKVPDSYPELSYQTTITLEHSDCKNGEVTSSRVMNYSMPFGQGELVHSLSRPRSEAMKDMEAPVPGSFGATILKAVCAMKLNK
jgi:hypothetical protein